MEGREVGSRGGERARRYLLHRIRGLGLDSLGSMVKPFDAGRQGDAVVKGANVVALVKGTVDPANHLVVTAHYDHEGVRRGEIYNGRRRQRLGRRGAARHRRAPEAPSAAIIPCCSSGSMGRSADSSVRRRSCGRLPCRGRRWR
jgi:hypothetical protein